MRPILTVPSLLASVTAFALTACQGVGWSHEEALAADKIEIQVDDHGRRQEVEYHISPDLVPAAVRQAMEDLHAGGTLAGAEVEWNDGVKFYELTKTIAGRDVEAMFYPDGRLFQEENQVAAESVPEACRAAVRQRFPGGTGVVWEAIGDAERTVVEYHAKLTDAGKKYKLMVSLDGSISQVVREVVAELEIPVK